ncbi:c-type cytochrome [Leptothrix sp. BB-4]
MSLVKLTGWTAALALAAALAGIAWLERPRALPAASTGPAPVDTPDQIARGAYLARIGNCAGCHAAEEGAPLAGGRPIATPYGDVIASNLTPDPETGLGRWSVQDFRRALREGISRDGRLLYPAFPYTGTTRLPDPDLDALGAYLRSLPPVRQPRADHRLRFPYSTQTALWAWRLLNFSPGELNPDPTRSTEWNRGRLLVEGLGHCGACHQDRGLTGGPAWPDVPRGATMPDGRWHAPSLQVADQAGVAGWPQADVAALLRDGITPDGRARANGPMAEVVLGGTRHLDPADLAAMATYLRALPAVDPMRQPVAPDDPARLARGRQLYVDHCADCHGAEGQGRSPAYPALAGNRVVTMDPPLNLLQALLRGGFAPATEGHPRPYGMPPFAHQLDDEELAALASYLRQAWGHRASAVGALEVQRVR